MTTLNDFLSAQLSRAREHRVWRLEQHMDSPASLGRMQQGVRDLLRQSLRLPSWEGDLAMTRKACGTVEDMRLEKLYYTAEDGLRTPAWLLLPYDVTASTPVVVCLHGHGYGSRDIVGLRSEETYQKRFALRVCQAGMIALAPELCGFGELRLAEELRADDNDKANSCHRLSVNLLACGRTLLGVRVQQALRALDAAQALFADHPLGMMGISGGGTVTTLTAALDARVQACVISGYANTFEDSILAMRHCVDNYWFNMAGQLEMAEILACVVPRPMLWETGSGDAIYPQRAALQTAERIRACYRLLDDEAAFEIDAFEGVHEISGARAYAFLRENLK